jgi:hypothetical protein
VKSCLIETTNPGQYTVSKLHSPGFSLSAATDFSSLPQATGTVEVGNFEQHFNFTTDLKIYA